MDSKELTRLARGVERAQHLTADQRVHLWMLTINNPQKNADAFTAWSNDHPDVPYTLPGAYSTWKGTVQGKDGGSLLPYRDAGITTGSTLRREEVDRGEAESYVRWALERFVHGARARQSRGAMACAEIGKTGTFHLHMAACFAGRNGGTARTLVELFPTADIEVARGSVDAVVAYLEKSGKWADGEKGETTVVPPIAMGASLVPNPGMAQSGTEGKVSKRDARWNTLFNLMTAHGKTVTDLLMDSKTAVMAKDLLPALDRLEATIRDRQSHTRDVRFICVTVRDERLLPSVRAEVRRYLDSKGNWGEWDFDLAVQPSVRADTRTLLIDRPPAGGSAIDYTYQLISGAPMRVPQGYGRGFWAAWTTVVVVCTDLPKLLESLHPCRVFVGEDDQPGCIASRLDSMDEHNDGPMSMREIGAAFEVIDVQNIPADNTRTDDCGGETR